MSILTEEKTGLSLRSAVFESTRGAEVNDLIIVLLSALLLGAKNPSLHSVFDLSANTN